MTKNFDFCSCLMQSEYYAKCKIRQESRKRNRYRGKRKKGV